MKKNSIFATVASAAAAMALSFTLAACGDDSSSTAPVTGGDESSSSGAFSSGEDPTSSAGVESSGSQPASSGSLNPESSSGTHLFLYYIKRLRVYIHLIYFYIRVQRFC